MHAPAEDGCPGEDDFAAYVHGGLAPEHVQTLDAHVARCSGCRRLLSVLARAVTLTSGPADSMSATLPAEPSSGESELQLGARFGRYIVVGWLGAGGMGVVYAAHDPELNRKVALKVLRNDGGGTVDRSPIREALLREAQAMAQLAHPNVVTVFDVGSVDDRVFIAMELIDGLTLRKWLAAAPRERSEILATFVAAGNGLAAAHAAGLIHRDFKPDNVLIGSDGRVRVTDFGLARPALRSPVDPAADPGRGAGALTGVAGTLAYMAPEQYLRRTADARADQFSFAVALYEALYGERPFGALEIATGKRPPSWRATGSARGGGLAAGVRRALLRALSPEADERYPSMDALLAALAPRPRRGRAIAVGALVAAGVAVAVAGYTIHQRRTAEERTQLVGHLRGLAPDMRTQLRNEHLLPRHDIRPARDKVRGALRDVERRRDTAAGEDEAALIDFVLGEGHRALGEHERALARLEAAWAAGERGPHIEAALGAALGAVYENQLTRMERTVPSSQRDVQIRGLDERYRDPAMVHLRAALAANASSPAYLEAMIGFREHRFAEVARIAHAAFAESPTLYEAGVLEARAHHRIALQFNEVNKVDEADAEFERARQIFARVLEVARSDDEAWLGFAEMVNSQASLRGRPGGGLAPELRQQAIDALHAAREINPDNWEPYLRESDLYLGEGNIEILRYRDPGAYVDKALLLAEQARAHGADGDEVDALVCQAYWERGVHQGAHGIDPRATYRQAIEACERAVAARSNANNHGSLAIAYFAAAEYDGEHGGDPMPMFELGEQQMRTTLSIDNDAGLHYNLGRLLSKVARYQSSHGLDPRRAVDGALPEFENTAQRDGRRGARDRPRAHVDDQVPHDACGARRRGADRAPRRSHAGRGQPPDRRAARADPASRRRLLTPRAVSRGGPGGALGAGAWRRRGPVAGAGGKRGRASARDRPDGCPCVDRERRGRAGACRGRARPRICAGRRAHRRARVHRARDGDRSAPGRSGQGPRRDRSLITSRFHWVVRSCCDFPRAADLRGEAFHHLERHDMKELLSLMALPLLFIVACAELAGDEGAANRDCRPKAEAGTKPAVPAHPHPHPTADPCEPCSCADDAEPQVWDGTGRSEAVRGT
jgi:tetratricopeptide (TPR) repeat protein/predicted Ser/Thr protein kinase